MQKPLLKIIREVAEAKGKISIVRNLPCLFYKLIMNFFDFFLIAIFGAKNITNMYLAIFAFRCEHGLFLFSKNNLRIYRSCRQYLWRIKKIDPRKVKYSILSSTPNYIEDGKWDLKKEKLRMHPTIKALFVDKKQRSQVAQYNAMKKAIKEKDWTQPSYWCRSMEDLEKYFDILISAYKNIKKHGYKTQKQLAIQNNTKNYNKWNEIQISIGRNGEYILEASGTHRLAIVQLLKIKEIPVIVVRKHYLWFKKQRKLN